MLIDSLKTKLTIIHALKAMLNNIINNFFFLLSFLIKTLKQVNTKEFLKNIIFILRNNKMSYLSKIPKCVSSLFRLSL